MSAIDDARSAMRAALREVPDAVPPHKLSDELLGAKLARWIRGLAPGGRDFASLSAERTELLDECFRRGWL